MLQRTVGLASTAAPSGQQSGHADREAAFTVNRSKLGVQSQ
jgi:hypothetical protein